jgi:hypothetical protein
LILCIKYCNFKKLGNDIFNKNSGLPKFTLLCDDYENVVSNYPNTIFISHVINSKICTLKFEDSAQLFTGFALSSNSPSFSQSD